MIARHPDWSALVVVPAQDEAALVGRSLRSVIAALGAVEVDRSLVVLVADRCTDDTVARARRVLGEQGVVVEVDGANVGAARAAGVDAGLVALGKARPVAPGRTWIASTDGDTRVPVDWVAQHLALAQRGWAAVAGVVELGDDLADQGVRGAFAASYAVPADGPHDHVHGANLGIRADAYCDVGGWPAIPLAEDHELWARVRRRGWPTTAVSSLRVTTSGRPAGRAPGGFAADIRRLGARHGNDPGSFGTVLDLELLDLDTESFDTASRADASRADASRADDVGTVRDSVGGRPLRRMG